MEAGIPDSETPDIPNLIEDEFQVLFAGDKDTTVAERWCRAWNGAIDKSEDALLILVAARRARNSPSTLSCECLSNLAEPSYVLIGRSHLGNAQTPALQQQVPGPKISSVSSLTHQTKLNRD